MTVGVRYCFFCYKTLAITAFCMGVAGCTIGPDYRKPETSSPTAYRFGGESKTAPVLAKDWWTIFGDPELNQHVEAALAANQDLASAVARFDESRALLGVARSSEYPNASIDPFYARSQPSNIVALSPALIKSLYVIPAEVGYEVDFWGRVRRSVNAARAQLASNADEVATVRLSLAADTTIAYLLLRSDDREVAVLQQTLKIRDDALQLAERRADAGAVGDIDVVRARADRALTEADLKEVQRRRELTLHAMAVLEGRMA